LALQPIATTAGRASSSASQRFSEPCVFTWRSAGEVVFLGVYCYCDDIITVYGRSNAGSIYNYEIFRTQLHVTRRTLGVG